MIFKLLNWQGLAGIGVSLALSVLLFIQRAETTHWKKQSASFEQLYRQEQTAFSTTTANYRAAADQARTADEANSKRVAAEQASLNQRTTNEFQARLATVRADAQRLRVAAQSAAADPGAGGSASVPGLPGSAGGPAQASGKDRLSFDDRQLATEQAIQLDELIKWVKAQASIDPNINPHVESVTETR